MQNIDIIQRACPVGSPLPSSLYWTASNFRSHTYFISQCWSLYDMYVMQPSLVKSLSASKANINVTHISMPQDSLDMVELPGPSGETLVLYMWCCFCHGPRQNIRQFIIKQFQNIVILSSSNSTLIVSAFNGRLLTHPGYSYNSHYFLCLSTFTTWSISLLPT